MSWKKASLLQNPKPQSPYKTRIPPPGIRVFFPKETFMLQRQDSICQISAASIKNGINGRIQKGICEIGCPCSCRCRTSRLGLPYRGENSNGKRSCLQLAANPGSTPIRHSFLPFYTPYKAMSLIGCRFPTDFCKVPL